MCADIVRRYGAGETAQALATEYDVSRNAVLNLLRENSVVVRRQPPSDEQKVKVIICYTEADQRKVERVLSELRLTNDESIIVIDARSDNKPSASKA